MTLEEQQGQAAADRLMAELSMPVGARNLARNLWSAQAAKFKPVSWERVAVVGEELGTQRANEPGAAPGAWVPADYLHQLENQRAEIAQLRRDNELLVQLANDQRAAHVAELAKLMASAAQTVVAPVPAPPPTKPTIPMRALTFQRQVVGLLTGRPA